LNTATPYKAIHPASLAQWKPAQQNEVKQRFVARRPAYLLIKRGADILFSAVVIIFLLSWLTPLLALLIKASSKGPVFFRQKRIGKNGNPFNCIKFRTMIQNEEADDVPAEENDDRITRVGHFLRLTNIDELPQFFNVLTGKMSVVGPRPHMVADCIRFSFVIPSYSFRHLARPGITGWAQVNGCHGPTPDYDSVMLRYYWDAMYVRKASLLLDFKIILQTVIISFSNIFSSLKRRKPSVQSTVQ
jgi:putative colanic acid biosysnthesis UDP-glucose lipid carrier transferase